MAYNEEATAVWHGFAASDDRKKVDSSPALLHRQSTAMYIRKRIKYHEIAKRHSRWYHDEAYLHFSAVSVMVLRSSDLFSRSILSSINQLSATRRAWWITFDHNYARSPRTIITVLPLFYLTCRRVPGPPVFLRWTLKNWVWPGDEASPILDTTEYQSTILDMQD